MGRRWEAPWLQRVVYITHTHKHTHANVHTHMHIHPYPILYIDPASMIPPEQSFQIEL